MVRWKSVGLEDGAVSVALYHLPFAIFHRLRPVPFDIGPPLVYYNRLHLKLLRLQGTRNSTHV